MFSLLIKQIKQILIDEVNEVRKEIRESEALIRTDLAQVQKELRSLQEG